MFIFGQLFVFGLLIFTPSVGTSKGKEIMTNEGKSIPTLPDSSEENLHNLKHTNRFPSYFISDIYSEITAVKSDVERRFSYIESRIENISSNNQKEHEIEEEDMLWPEGSFSLLMPDSGCPQNPYAWSKGFIKVRQENPDRFFPVNAPVHLASPYTEMEFVYLQFCSINDSKDRQQPWPTGSYCIHKVPSFPCPSGFHPTQLSADAKDDVRNFMYGSIPGSVSRYGFWLHFCCRHDGNYSNPITLPVSKPFYLFKHKGICQKVKGMDISQDLVIVATEGGYGNDDKWLPGYDEDHQPDVSIDPVSEELCYYSKSNI